MQSKFNLSNLLILFFVVLFLICLFALPANYFIPRIKDAVIKRIEESLEKNLTLAVHEVRIALHRGGIGFRLYNLALHEKGGNQQEIFSSEYLFVGLDIKSLLLGDIQIQRLFGFRPRMCLIRNPLKMPLRRMQPSRL